MRNKECGTALTLSISFRTMGRYGGVISHRDGSIDAPDPDFWVRKTDDLGGKNLNLLHTDPHLAITRNLRFKKDTALQQLDILNLGFV
jgi:hypothetical protein